MITDLIIIVLPCVQVQMLQLRCACLGTHSPLGDEQMIQLLRVHIEQVSVSLLGRNSGNLIEVEHGTAGHEGLEGFDLGELVEVAGSNDAGLGIDLQDRSDEVLEMHCQQLRFLRTPETPNSQQ
jgi:hypothetical protein